MSSINNVIYFGAVPGKNQVVADGLKNKGINLLRAEPATIQLSGSPRWLEPNFQIYRNYLPLFINAAIKKTRVAFGSSPFSALRYPKEWPIIPIALPSLVISWDKPVAEEVAASLRKKGFRDIFVRGKPAMIHDRPTIEIARDASETRCLESSPAPENCCNLYALKKAVLVMRIVSAFLKVHQYPAFIDEGHADEFGKGFAMDATEAKDQEISMSVDEEDDDDEEEDSTNHTIKGSFTVNLPESPEKRPLFYDEHLIRERISSGLLFQYEPLLAKFDRSTILTTLRNYFYGCFGDTRGEAAQVWQDVVSGVNILHNTEWGHQMAHICKIIDISLRMQTVPYIMMTASHYDGIYMCGAGYHLGLGENYFSPLPKDIIAERIKTFDSHAEAFWKILGCLDILEDTKLNAFKTNTSIKQLKQLCDSHSIKPNGMATIKATSHLLSFRDDKTLESTGSNIAMALEMLSDPSKDIYTLPSFHHTALLSQERDYIIWSAFGETAPSFIVPGGRRMALSGNFAVSHTSAPAKGGGVVNTRQVTKIGAIIKPLAAAVADLREVKSGKSVANPFGNAVVNAAQSHMNKVYEKESCQLILSGLRKYVDVRVEDVGRGKKRRNEGDESSRPKRSRLDDL